MEAKKEMDYCLRWKSAFLSKDPKQRIIALVEIVKMLNSVTPANKKLICRALINSDICNFILENVSSKTDEMKLINKIVLCLSEDETFFQHLFNKLVRAYVRVLNCLLTCGSKNFNFLNDIVAIIMILIERALKTKMDIGSQIPLNLFLSIFESLTEKKFDSVKFLELFSSSLEMFNQSTIYQGDKKMIDTRLQSIFNQLDLQLNKSSTIILNFGKTMMSSIQYFCKSMGGNFFEKYLLDNFLRLVDYIMDENERFCNFDCFLNLTFYLMSNLLLSFDVKFKIVSYILQKDGFNFMIELIKMYESDCKIITIKLKVLILNMLVFVIQRANSEISYKNELKLMKLCYQIVFFTDFSLIASIEMCHELKSKDVKEEHLLIIIYKHYVTLVLVQSTYFARNILIDLMTILRILDAKGVGLNEFFIDPVLKMFAHFHRSLTPQDFSFIKKYSHIFLGLASQKPISDIEILLFLKQLNDDIKMSEKLQENYIKLYITDDLSSKAVELFDQSMLKKQLFAVKTSNVTLMNVLRLLNYKEISSVEEKLCLSRINYYLSDKEKRDNEFRMLCFMSVLAKLENYDKEFKIEIIKTLLKLMESKEHQSLDIRIVIVKLSVSVLISKQLLRDGSSLEVEVDGNEGELMDVDMKALEN